MNFGDEDIQKPYQKAERADEYCQGWPETHKYSARQCAKRQDLDKSGALVCVDTEYAQGQGVYYDGKDFDHA